MPQKGDEQHGATEHLRWDGHRWNPIEAPKPATVDNPRSFGVLDYIPGLRDALNIPENLVKGAQALPDVARGLYNEPAATLKGFAGGASEAATPGRVGLLALLTGGATVPAALAAAGGESLAQAGRVATDAPNAPQSFPEAVGNVAEAASVPGVAAGLKAVPEAVQSLGGTRKVAGRVLGAGLGGYEGYRYGGIPGAIAGAAGGGALGGMTGGSPTMRALRAVIGGGADEAASAPAAIESRVAPAVEAAPRPDSVLSGIRLSPDAVERNIEATNLRDVEGYSQKMAGKLAGIPGAGESRLIPDTHLGDSAITDEMIRNRGGSVTSAPEKIDWPDDVPDPRDPDVAPSMRGLEAATAPVVNIQRLPASWMNLPTDDEMDADILARKASGKWSARQ